MDEEFEPDEDEIIYENYGDRRPSTPSSPRIYPHNSVCPWNKDNDGVTTLYRCEVEKAKSLYVFDIAHKLQRNDYYDIGGVYKKEAGLWFYFSTTTCPGYNYLINIFACNRLPSMFALGISKSNTLTHTVSNGENIATLNTELEWLKFNSTQTDEIHYVKTFLFTEKDRTSLLNKVLLIPIKIDYSSKSMLNKDVLQKIKAEHDFGEQLLKDQEVDFTVKSNSGTERKVHKIVLAAHSPVIRDAVRAKECNMLSLDISDQEMDLLLQYVYTGTIKDILDQKFEVLLEIAEKYHLENLLVQVKYAIKESICSANALSVAVLAEKYNYKEIQDIAFKYIEMHPEVLESEAFSEIDNTNLVKKLLKYIHVKGSSK